MSEQVTRRGLLICASLLAFVRRAFGEPAGSPYRVIQLDVQFENANTWPALVVLPSASVAAGSLPLLVLLHGLGETRDARAGSHAWLEAYGLGRALADLAEPSLALAHRENLSDVELAEWNRCIALRPFEGLCIACPYMPNPNGNSRAFRLGRYTAWLSDALIPRIRAEVAEVTREAARTGIAGVSLGGKVALEAVLQRPRAYAALGSVQGAFGVELATSYARRLAALAAPPRRAYVASSSFDPYLKANQALAGELVRGGVECDFCLRNGPHSQGFLRDIASIDLLLWADRALRAPASAQADAVACHRSIARPAR